MGTYDPVHSGQRTARRQTANQSHRTTCSFCGHDIADHGDERITHEIPAGDGTERSVEYCSPSCFIREMERVSGIENCQ